MTILMTPAILFVSFPAPYASATDVQQRITSHLKGKAIFIPEDPFGTPERRVDMDGVLFPDGQEFALEITASWMRVWVGSMAPQDDVWMAHNRQQCERIAAMVAEATGGTVEEGVA